MGGNTKSLKEIAGAARVNLTAPSNLTCLLFKLYYSVLRLRSQLTRPTPMLPNRIAPGAGTAVS